MTTLLPESATHAAAVERLRTSYLAIPPGQSVRLAKRTSNLFRPRTSEPTTGLDVSGLDGVICLDTAARTADVQGMCTYERLVEATLRHGLMPKVVPQLKTITLGGAVTGLGIESSSFRNGLPHESVLELDVLTGAGDLLTISPTQHPDLYAGFPNSYGSLGYAVRLRIELDRIHPFVGLRHVRFDDLDELAGAIETVCRTRSWQDEPVDFLDGVMFSPTESYLTLGRWVNSPAEAGVAAASDYTGQRIFSACSTRWCAGCGRPGTGAATSTTG
jgi:FAD/FMN-containing dehydrogenase